MAAFFDAAMYWIFAAAVFGVPGAVWYFTRNAKLAIAIFVILLAFGGGWKLRDYQAAEQERAAAAAALESLNAAIKAKEDLQTKLQEDSAELEKKLALLRAQKEKTRIVRVREYAKPVYNECVVPDDGVQLLNDAIAEINASRATR